MRILMKLFAPILYGIASWLFHSPLARSSKAIHKLTMKLLRFAADNGSVSALALYGHLLHFRGEDVQSRIQGAIYLERAASKGDMKSQYQMGKVYENGYEHYFQPSDSRALNFYTLAAKQGHALAISRIVKIYKNGELSESPDNVQFLYWQEQKDLQGDLP